MEQTGTVLQGLSWGGHVQARMSAVETAPDSPLTFLTSPLRLQPSLISPSTSVPNLHNGTSDWRRPPTARLGPEGAALLSDGPTGPRALFSTSLDIKVCTWGQR